MAIHAQSVGTFLAKGGFGMLFVRVCTQHQRFGQALEAQPQGAVAILRAALLWGLQAVKSRTQMGALHAD